MHRMLTRHRRSPWMAARSSRPAPSSGQVGPSTRDMERLNWMEFREWVPAKINTVLLPLGSLEAHGVTANGTDILAPVAMATGHRRARQRARRAGRALRNHRVARRPTQAASPFADEAYRAYVKAVALGLARNKFRNLIFVNGHGGNTAALNASPPRSQSRRRPDAGRQLVDLLLGRDARGVRRGRRPRGRERERVRDGDRSVALASRALHARARHAQPAVRLLGSVPAPVDDHALQGRARGTRSSTAPRRRFTSRR